MQFPLTTLEDGKIGRKIRELERDDLEWRRLTVGV